MMSPAPICSKRKLDMLTPYLCRKRWSCEKIAEQVAGTLLWPSIAYRVVGGVLATRKTLDEWETVDKSLGSCHSYRILSTPRCTTNRFAQIGIRYFSVPIL
uniref:Uncharacterized protein n=1 Tax=Opuntia streptacantha TaxID=393608 RepID=A0A7C8ZNW5_OPUST